MPTKSGDYIIVHTNINDNQPGLLGYDRGCVRTATGWDTQHARCVVTLCCCTIFLEGSCDHPPLVFLVATLDPPPKGISLRIDSARRYTARSHHDRRPLTLDGCRDVRIDRASLYFDCSSWAPQS